MTNAKTNCTISVETASTDIQVHEDTKLRLYHIYHTINKQHSFTEKVEQPRRYIGFVMASSLEDAFTKAQNEDKFYQKYNVRSTSVGDFIQDCNYFYMVKGQGFECICSLDDYQDDHEMTLKEKEID